MSNQYQLSNVRQLSLDVCRPRENKFKTFFLSLFEITDMLLFTMTSHIRVFAIEHSRRIYVCYINYILKNQISKVTEKFQRRYVLSPDKCRRQLRYSNAGSSLSKFRSQSSLPPWNLITVSSINYLLYFLNVWLAIVR
jgi:hypothetical protein